MARERDDEVDASSELDDLHARGPEPLAEAQRQSARPDELAEKLDEPVDLTALAARSKNTRPSDQSPKSAVRVEPRFTSRSRGWLPLAIGIGVGVVATLIASSLRPRVSSDRPIAPPSAAGQRAAEVHPPLPPAAAPSPPPSAASESAAEVRPASPPIAAPPPPPSAADALAASTSPPSAAERQTAAAKPAPTALGSASSPAPSRPSATAMPAASSAARAPAAADGHPADRPSPPSAADAPKTNKPEPAPDSEEARLAAASVRDSNASDSPLDDMLDDAFTHGDAKAHQRNPVAKPAPMPIAPTRDDVMKAMTVLVPAIRGCAQGHSGLATAAIVVRNDGKVDSVRVTGQPFEDTASGRCMEGVVRRAHFPRFQQPAFRVQFPFSIQ